MNINNNASDKENFWIKVYMKQQDNSFEALVKASIWRAYRDFSRTLHGLTKLKFSKDEVDEKRKEFEKILFDIVHEVRSLKEFSSQDEFDKWHEEKCKLLKENFREIMKYENIYIGQCQKWINMTLKYLFMLGENRISGIETNYRFFHVPIDNIIQDEFLEKYQIAKLEKPWSRTEDYDKYLNYQKEIRQKIGGSEIPLQLEIKLFNNATRVSDNYSNDQF